MDLVRKSACGSNLEALALEQGIVLARVGHTRMVAMHAISTHPQFFCYQMAITKKRFFFSSPFCIYVPCANDSTHHLFFFFLQGRAAACSVKLVYLDEDVRVVEDKTGDLFVYTRPVVSRL